MLNKIYDVFHREENRPWRQRTTHNCASILIGLRINKRHKRCERRLYGTLHTHVTDSYPVRVYQCLCCERVACSWLRVPRIHPLYGGCTVHSSIPQERKVGGIIQSLASICPTRRKKVAPRRNRSPADERTCEVRE